MLVGFHPVVAYRFADYEKTQFMAGSDTILVAEDDESDVDVILRAFKKGRFLNPLKIVHDGAEAIAYLSGDGAYANCAEYPLPGLLLLDIRMPREDGFQVLRWVRHK